MHPVQELCAKVCEERADLYKSNTTGIAERMLIAEGAARNCAAAIRALPQADIDGAGGAVARSKDPDLTWEQQCAPAAPTDEARKLIKQLREVSSYAEQYSLCQAAAAMLSKTAAMADGLADTIIAGIIKDIRGRKGIGDEWESIDVDVRNEIVQTWREIIAAAQGEKQ